MLQIKVSKNSSNNSLAINLGLLSLFSFNLIVKVKIVNPALNNIFSLIVLKIFFWKKSFGYFYLTF